MKHIKLILILSGLSLLASCVEPNVYFHAKLFQTDHDLLVTDSNLVLIIDQSGAPSITMCTTAHGYSDQIRLFLPLDAKEGETYTLHGKANEVVYYGFDGWTSWLLDSRKNNIATVSVWGISETDVCADIHFNLKAIQYVNPNDEKYLNIRRTPRKKCVLGNGKFCFVNKEKIKQKYSTTTGPTVLPSAGASGGQ